MFASHAYVFRHLHLPRSRLLRVRRSHRSWMRRLKTWLVGGLDAAGEPVVRGETPVQYIANNHLRRDIGLPPVSSRGWPY